MVKIKQKKQLNLPQLIEWGFENDITGAIFSDDRDEVKRIRFEIGLLVSIHGDMHKQDTFTVEEEIEITEDTRLDKLVVRYRNDDIYIFPQERIDDFKNDSNIVAFYIPNDDFTLTLIWSDGKLIE